MTSRRSTHWYRLAAMVALLGLLPLSAHAGDPKPPRECGDQRPAQPLVLGRAEQQPSTRQMTSPELEMPFIETSTRRSPGLVTLKFRDPVGPAEDRHIRNPWLARHPDSSITPTFEPPVHIQPPLFAFSLRTQRPSR
jgi:hypothetical protein